MPSCAGPACANAVGVRNGKKGEEWGREGQDSDAGILSGLRGEGVSLTLNSATTVISRATNLLTKRGTNQRKEQQRLQRQQQQ